MEPLGSEPGGGPPPRTGPRPRASDAAPRRTEAESVERIGGAAAPAPPRAAGAPPAARGALSPRSAGELVDDAIDVLKRHFAALLGVAFAVWIPVSALLLEVAPAAALEEHLLLDLLVAVASGAVATSFVAAAAALVVRAEVLGRAESLAARSAALARAMPALLVLALFTSFAQIAGGLVSFFVLTVYFWWRWQFAQVALVLEGGGPLRALRRSWALTRRGFLHYLGAYATVTLIVLPLQVVSAGYETGYVTEYFQRAFPTLGAAGHTVLTVASHAAVLALPTALLAVLVALAYLQRRVRAEGFDLRVRIDALARP